MGTKDFNNNLTQSTLRIGVGRTTTWRPVRGVRGLEEFQLRDDIIRIKKKVLPLPPTTPASPVGKNGVPKALLSVSATESPVKQQDRTFSLVSISFTRDTSDASFASVRVYFKGFKGNANATLMPAGGDTSPLSFLCESTGETVTVLVQPVGATGASAPLTYAATCTLKLDGVVSAPPAPTITQNLTTTPTGLQFTFAQEGGLLADVIQSYKVYHNSTNNSSTATVYKTYVQDPSNAGQDVVVQETLANGTVMYYWVSSVNTSGLESSKTAAQSSPVTSGSMLNSSGRLINPDQIADDGATYYRIPYQQALIVHEGVYNGSFETFPNTKTVADGWTTGFETTGSGYSYTRSSTANVGSLSQGIVNGASGGTSVASRPFAVKGNLKYVFECYIRSSIANPGTVYMRVCWYSSTTDMTRTGSSFISLTDVVSAGGPTSANVWQAFAAEVTAPATAKYARVALYNWSGSSCTVLFDGVAWGIGSMDPSLGLLVANGSVPPAVSDSFTYTNTASNLTWSWSGLTIYRCDGTTTAVSNSSLSESSLSASTTYYYYPYFDDTANLLKWVGGSGHGTHGNSFLAAQRNNTQAQTQNLNANIPLSNGPMSATTTASGSGGGGSGGGSGSCVRSRMLVEEKTKGVIPAYRVEAGDYLRSKDGWVKVLVAEERPNDVFVRVCVDGHYLDVTPWHPFEAMDAACNHIPSIEAARLTGLHQLYTINGANFVEGWQMVRDPEGKKMRIECEEPHTFFAGQDTPYILAHNLQMIC